MGGRYRLLSPLGSGASAEVYLADDVRLRRRVAVKILHAALADDEAFLRRFRAEARAAAALNHPNIVAIFDWNGDEVPPYLVTEYLGGGSLRSILDTGARLTPSQALLVGLQASQALDHAHRQGFVHRDIKPANLLFGSEARLRIADFGLARAIAEAGWTEPTGAVLGTARYASPEQVRGEPLDGRSDVYSLALVLIEAVTGAVPFSADTTIGTLMSRLDRPVTVPEEMDALCPLLERAGQPVPGDRLEAGSLAKELMAVATELPRPAPLVLGGATARGQSPSDTDRQDAAVAGGSAQGAGPPVPQGPNGSGHIAGPGMGGPAVSMTPGTTVVHRPDDERDRTMVHPIVSMPPAASGNHFSPSHAVSWRRRDLRPWLLRVLLVVAAVVVGAAGAWFFLQSRVPSHDVPQDLIGAERGAINGIVGEYRWRIDEQEIYRDDTQPGTVIETSPAPGTSLREGETLVVRISLGPPLVQVPSNDDLAGLSQEQADGLLRAEGVELVPEFVQTPSDDVDEDLVIGLEEGTPTQLPKGSTVRVLISSGTSRVRLQNMRGWDADDAEAELERQGLDVERETQRSNDVEEGMVIRTEPGANAQVDTGDTVTLVVSSGEDGDGGGDGDRVAVPDVWGMSVDEATDELEDAGLEVGDVNGPDDGEVFATSPMIDSEVDAGTEIDLWVW